MEGPNKEIRENKVPLRTRIEKDVEAFLAAGNKIKVDKKLTFKEIKQARQKKVTRQDTTATEWLQRKLDD